MSQTESGDRSPNEEYLINESSEIAVGESIGWTQKIMTAFPALRSRNYQLYFIGQLVSLVGTWLQIVAEGWLVFELTHSAFFVGLDAAAATIPTLFLSLFGGVIVDKFPKKRILMFTQIASMVLAFILGLLTVLKVVNVWHVIILAFLLGVVNAIDSPARQSYVIELVDDKKYLSSAIALNSGMWNAARVIGPTVAGLLIAAFGAGIAFLLNGISYVAVIIALRKMNTSDIVIDSHLRPLTAIKEGILYAFSHSTIRFLIITASMLAIFGWSYSTLMPVLATDIFHLGASGLGYLYAVAGTGALAGAVFISSRGTKLNSLNIIIGGNLLFAVALLAFTFSTNIYVATVLLLLIGFGLVAEFSTVNTVLQHAVDNTMRGRVMAIYTIAFIGLAPFGNFEIGWAAQRFGTEMAIRLSAVIVLAFGFLIFFRRHAIRKYFVLPHGNK